MSPRACRAHTSPSVTILTEMDIQVNGFLAFPRTDTLRHQFTLKQHGSQEDKNRFQNSSEDHGAPLAGYECVSSDHS